MPTPPSLEPEQKSPEPAPTPPAAKPVPLPDRSVIPLKGVRVAEGIDTSKLDPSLGKLEG
jgi:hypothetical protein